MAWVLVGVACSIMDLVSLPMTLGTILAERLVDLVTLVSLLTAAALTVYGGRLPQQGLEALLAGLGLGLAGMTGLLLLPRSHRLLHRFVPFAGTTRSSGSSTVRFARSIGCPC